MLMLVLNGVGMGGAVVGVGNDMLVDVAVLPCQGVQNHDHGPRDHDGQAHEIRPCGSLIKEEKGQGGTDEGGDGVVGAGLGGADHALGLDVKEDT